MISKQIDDQETATKTKVLLSWQPPFKEKNYMILFIRIKK